MLLSFQSLQIAMQQKQQHITRQNSPPKLYIKIKTTNEKRQGTVWQQAAQPASDAWQSLKAPNTHTLPAITHTKRKAIRKLSIEHPQQEMHFVAASSSSSSSALFKMHWQNRLHRLTIVCKRLTVPKTISQIGTLVLISHCGR